MGKQNKKTRPIAVAVSGGFDPLHIGHVRMFQEAKELGDTLVVILNNDNWLMAKKGHVFMPELERKEILEALSWVDKVVLTSHQKNPKDMSVCKELLRIKPHIFANGGDRNKRNIPEVKTCEILGCKMVFNVGHGGKVQSSSWLLENHSKMVNLGKQAKILASKKIIAFDLDGTLTESKSGIDREMTELLCKLLEQKKVAVLGGGNWSQFQNQFLRYVRCAKNQSKNLLILPTSGASLYRLRNGVWKKVYQNKFSAKEKSKIFRSFEKAFRDIKYVKPEKICGKVIEDRESQITFSALGQKAPLAQKEKWNKTKNRIRPLLKSALKKYLPEFEIRLGGLTSIDVTKRGIDKAYGIRQLLKIFDVLKDGIVYIGDALYKGGNDEAVFKAGVATVGVRGPKETKHLIRRLLANLRDQNLKSKNESGR